ncbi:aldose 1-epimerase [Dyadobacter koreensis]|uniref:Aldose 1-epimerase n=1 Tax=Dyadobacter koreensis TaxID=408657 RepID=A0A1H6TL26_9BACT|nr:aldose 1-epimerase [Dyadobacter koreensis]SEI76945.1 aldose 1-epimerase [Dyadobacter koreensis]
MAFEIQKQQYGELTEYVIQETATSNRFVVVPELGGIVRQLSLRKGVTLFSLLKTPATPNALAEDTQSASELLFPFASRIPDGKYKFLGKHYQLALNNGDNAIHGLVRKNRFQLVEQVMAADHAYIKLSYEIREPEGYPFSVDFTVKYKLSADGIFSLTYEAKNIGAEPCPTMFGWHPYFQIGNEMVDAWKINIPSDTIVVFDNRMSPIETAPFPIEGPMPLFKKALDNAFIVNIDGDKAVTQLISENQHVTLQIEQETGEGKFNHLVVYTPPARDCVGIEPLTANVNSFNNGEGLTTLPAGSSVSGTINIKLI